jgi:hypothetical protein
MASIIKIKRSSGVAAPASLKEGELAVTLGAGDGVNDGGKLFVGNDSGSVDVVGGKYFADQVSAATPDNNANTIVKRNSNSDIAVNNIFCNSVTASLAGNASTASQLQTARTINLVGDVTGSVSFDGSADVSITASVSDNFLSAYEVAAVAAGSTLGLEQQLLTNAGQPAKTVLAVGYTTSGKAQGVSLGDGNVVEVFANGTDFNAGTVLYREFLSFGEPICFTGLSNGAIITSTSGFYGFSDQVDGGDESPMPLLSYGLSFTETFFYAFRNCNFYNPAGTGANQGWVHIVNGPLKSTIKLTDGVGTTVRGQENIELLPWQYYRLYTDGNKEYIIKSTNPVMACHNANMDLNPHGRFFDSRLIMPLTSDGITWPRAGFISAPYNNTKVKWYTRDGVSGSINSGNGVSPGSPIDFDSAPPLGTGANDSRYYPNGATRVRATGLVSAYSGADNAGLEATPLLPTAAMSQVVAQPLFIDDAGNGSQSGVAIASPYIGTARIYAWNSATDSLELKYTVPLTRINSVNDRDDQYHPCAGTVSNDTSQSGVIPLVGDLNAGVVVADVPITVIVQNATPTYRPILRSQNGTTTSSIYCDDDETLSLGWTPVDKKVEITEAFDSGILYKREFLSDGAPHEGSYDEWVVA